MNRIYPVFILAALLCAFTLPKEKLFTLKKFEKKMVLFQPGLHACKYEASNLEYNEFLAFLERKGDMALLEKARIHKEKWGDVLSPVFIDNYGTHPSYADYPVVNVSQEGAELFCEWLTEQYNAYPKRQFKKVKFRLPTEMEWVKAAQAGNDTWIFPWAGPYLRESNGTYRANFKRLLEAQIKVNRETREIELDKTPFPIKPGKLSDRAHYTAPVDMSPQNDLGYCHIAGNVAEMLAETGRTKGGSWRSSGYYLRIDAEDEFAGFTEPSPEIGFRYFMEVVEE